MKWRSKPKGSQPSSRKVKRDEDHEEKQRIRRECMLIATAAGDHQEAKRIGGIIARADRARKMATQTKDGSETDSAARKERLSGVGATRIAQSKRIAQAVWIGIVTEKSPHALITLADCGQRDGAALAAGSADIVALVGQDRLGERIADTLNVAALRASGGDWRRRPVKEMVLVDKDMKASEATDRAMLAIACSGYAPDEVTWALMRHRGDDTTQGEHWHLIMVAHDIDRPGGHAPMHLAATIWARKCGAPDAAMPPSLGMGTAAKTDWERTDAHAEGWLKRIQPKMVQQSEKAAGGLWLFKGSAKSVDARARIEHALGLDV